MVCRSRENTYCLKKCIREEGGCEGSRTLEPRVRATSWPAHGEKHNVVAETHHYV